MSCADDVAKVKPADLISQDVRKFMDGEKQLSDL
jgi:hypothetical protein